MSRVAKLASIIIIILLGWNSLLFGGRKEIPLNQITPELLKRPKRIHILFFDKPVKKEVSIQITRKKLVIHIYYLQPKSFINKLIRVLSDIDKNQKINGFESDRIYDYFHKEMTKNAILQINGQNINCKTVSQKIPDIYGPTNSRKFEYYETLNCNIEKLLVNKKENIIFLSDYVKLPAHQVRFESPVKVTIKLPVQWKIKSPYITIRRGKWKIIRGIKLDRTHTAEIKFFPQ